MDPTTTMTTWQTIVHVGSILLLMGALAIIPAIGAAIWYAIKVWFTAKVARKGWGD
jgi:hypothetical protein